MQVVWHIVLYEHFVRLQDIEVVYFFQVTVMFCLSGTNDEVNYKSSYALFWLNNEIFVSRKLVQSFINTPARLL